MSDCWAIRDFHEHHGLTNDAKESAALAINNGCDLNCGNTYLHIMNAYQHGLVTEETITESAVRLFTTRFMLGLFDGSAYDQIPYEEVESSGHLALSVKAAEESMVLLKNNGILPLKKENLKTVGVIGPNANSRAALIGNYHGTASRYVTILEGIQDYLGEEARVMTSPGCALFQDRTEHLAVAGDRLSEAKIVADHSDVVILCLGLDETLEGEEGDTGNSYASGDKVDLKLPKVQQDLMEAIAETGKPVILCMMAGSDLDLSFGMEHFDAILQLWYPGAQGGKAAANILFGETSPSGKLPVTFYETLEELPEFEDYSMKGRTYRYMEHKAQYPFGYGLTYGDVSVTDAGIRDGEADAKEGMIITAEAWNDGAYATDEVLQVYVKCTDSVHGAKNPSLCAFKRIHLEPGEKQSFELPVSGSAFTVVDDEGVRKVDGKEFVFYVGCSQPDARSVELLGRAPVEINVTV